MGISLEERKELIIQLRKNGRTLQAIGDIFGVTRQRVEQIIRPRRRIKIRDCIVCDTNIIGPGRKYCLDCSMTLLSGMDTLREKVRMRDKHTCQKCGKKWEKGKRRFDTHHLDEEYEGLNGGRGYYTLDKTLLDRIITLCHKCHLNLPHIKAKMRVKKGIKSSVDKVY